jgi:hypothetical protein
MAARSVTFGCGIPRADIVQLGQQQLQQLQQGQSAGVGSGASAGRSVDDLDIDVESDDSGDDSYNAAAARQLNDDASLQRNASVRSPPCGRCGFEQQVRAARHCRTLGRA